MLIRSFYPANIMNVTEEGKLKIFQKMQNAYLGPTCTYLNEVLS